MSPHGDFEAFTALGRLSAVSGNLQLGIERGRKFGTWSQTRMKSRRNMRDMRDRRAMVAASRNGG